MRSTVVSAFNGLIIVNCDEKIRREPEGCDSEIACDRSRTVWRHHMLPCYYTRGSGYALSIGEAYALVGEDLYQKTLQQTKLVCCPFN